jgi:hypothetical protein
MSGVIINRYSESEIKLQTKLGNDIPNSQAHEHNQQEINQFKILKSTFPNVHKRTNFPPSIYNCHGLVFGSRRTMIFRSDVVRMCLDQDGYQKIEREFVQPGDIIIYVKFNGEIIHSGIVMATPCPERRMTTNMLILSKWGKYHEVLHYEIDCPYSRNNPDGRREFYRICE